MQLARSIIMSFYVILVALTSLSCEREQRQFREAPPAARLDTVAQSELQPGHVVPVVQTKSSYEERAYDLSEGKRLYEWYNCSGCHAHGGGSIGPPLMDDKWIYGGDPAHIFATIVEGRPNGMPSFRGKIPDSQVWQIAAYVRSMSGQVPKDVASGRDDDMSGKQPEQSTGPKQPKNSVLPPSAEQSQ